MKKKIRISVVAIILVLATVLSVVFALSREDTDYSLLESKKVDNPKYLDTSISDGEKIVLGTVNSLKLSYSSSNSAFWIEDIVNGTLFSSGVTENDFSSEQGGLSDAERYLLCQVGYTDFNGNSDVFTSADTPYSLTKKAIKNGIALKLYFDNYSIGFIIEVWLNEYGLCVRIPSRSIKENGNYGITSIGVFPKLGAAPDDQGGYAVYPDGSGSLYPFNSHDRLSGPVSTQVYFPSSFDMDEVSKNALLGEKYAMIPAYGICRGKTAAAAYVTSGDENSYVTLSPATQGLNLNCVSMFCRYRKSYSYISPTNVEINEIEKERSAGDFTVQYLFLSEKKGELTYSHIATAIRLFLFNSGRLTKSNTGNKINLQLIMGTRENTSMSKKFQALTTFSQARKMVEDIECDNKLLRIYLLGWQKNGYGLNPSGETPSSNLGGTRGLKKLTEWTKSKGLETYIVVDYLSADKNGKGFNKNSQAVYNEMNQPITNKDSDKFLLNPLKELQKLKSSGIKNILNFGVSGVAFDKIGNYLYDDYSKGRKLTRENSAAVASGLLSCVKKAGLSSASQSGNSYVLKFADYLYDIPETNSESTGFTRQIPFYQMIVHGFKGYCGTIPGNMSSDYVTEHLRWIEYGCDPNFVLTYSSSEKMKNTNITNAFSTDYKQQIKAIRECVKEYSGPLSFTGNQIIKKHEILSDGLVRITYDKGQTILINYNDSEQKCGGLTVKPKDYLITTGGKSCE